MSEAYGKLLYLYRRWIKKTKKLKWIPNDVNDLFKNYSKSDDCRNEGPVNTACPTPTPTSCSEIYDRDLMSIDRLKEFLIKEQGVGAEVVQKASQYIITPRNLKGFFNYQRNGLSLNGFFHHCILSRTFNPPLIQKEFDEGKTLAHYYVYASDTTYLRTKEVITDIQDAISQQIKIKLANNKVIQQFTSGNIPNDEYEPRKEKIVYSCIEAIIKALKRGVRVITLDLHKLSDSDFEVQHPKYKKVSGEHNFPFEGEKYKSYKLRQNSTLTLKGCLKDIKKNAFVKSEFPLIIVLVKHFDGSIEPLNELINNQFNRETELCDPQSAFNKPLNTLKKKFIILMKQGTTPTNNERERTHYMENFKGDFQNLKRSSPDKPVILSLTEKNLEKVKSEDILRFTRTNEDILAVYPNGKNPGIDSNYDPLIGWTLGAQIVALNMQDKDKSLWIMQGLFRAKSEHGKIHGYVKKPDILLKNSKFDPTEWRPVKKILKVKIYMGIGWHLDFDREDFDPSSRPDFFTAVEIVGVPADEAKEKTVPIMDEWIPKWNKEFEFPLTTPELAMLVIEVKEFDPDRTHEFGGQNCLPVSQLKSGIRCVPLYSKTGKPLRAAKLLVKFQFD